MKTIQTVVMGFFLLLVMLSAPSCSVLSTVLSDTGVAYTGRVGCTNPMTDIQFQTYKGTIQELDFEIAMEERIESSLPGRCIWTKHLRELAMMFDNEITRTDIIVLGYDSVYDLDNYTSLTSCVSNTFSKEEILDRAGF